MPEAQVALKSVQQELARQLVARDKTLAELKAHGEKCDAEEERLKGELDELRGPLQEWVKSGKPKDAGMLKKARRYVRLIEKAQDARRAAAYCDMILQQHEEEHSGDAPPAPLRKSADTLLVRFANSTLRVRIDR